MPRIEALFIGQPQTMHDARGSWRSTIFRQPVSGPVMLEQRGFVGDQVADTKHHGTLDQAVCCHPLAHYAAWNAEYGLDDVHALGPGSVGENWTLSDLTEADVCIGDVFQVGDAQVQLAGPRYPCSTQERRVGLKGFLNRTKKTRRTGFYLRVVTPGSVRVGDSLTLIARLHPEFSVERLNANRFLEVEPEFAARAVALPELMPVWKYMLQILLDKPPHAQS